MMVQTARAVVQADSALTKPRLSLVHLAVCMAAASLATSWFYQTPVISAKAAQLPVVQKKLEKVVTQDVPKLKKAVGCEHAAKEVALDAATGNPTALVGLPDCPDPATLKNLGKAK